MEFQTCEGMVKVVGFFLNKRSQLVSCNVFVLPFHVCTKYTAFAVCARRVTSVS